MDRVTNPRYTTEGSLPPVHTASATKDAAPEKGHDAPSVMGRVQAADYLFLLRPMILIPVWTFYLLGAYHGATIAGMQLQPARLLIGLVSFTALLGAIYIINQISDREVDLANRKLFLISHSIVPLWSAWVETSLLIASAFLLGLLFLPIRFVIVLLVSLALGAAYSLEPLRFKRRPVLDVLASAAGNGILNTLAGWIAIGAPLSEWAILLPYPLAVASVHLATTIADIEGDRSLGFRTSGVVLGAWKGVIVSTGLMTAAIVTAFIVHNRLAFYASLFSLPMFLIPARYSGKATQKMNVLLPVKVATLIFSVTAGFLFPLYIPFLAAVILLTRVYYKRRFGIVYPGFNA